MTTETLAAACLHSCQEGCGRTYDIVIIQVVDGSTNMMCIPCFMSFAHRIMTAMVEPENPAVAEVVEGADFSDVTYVDPNAVGYGIRGFSDPPAEDDFEFDGVDGE